VKRGQGSGDRVQDTGLDECGFWISETNKCGIKIKNPKSKIQNAITR
jgi:hypothetical protein